MMRFAMALFGLATMGTAINLDEDVISSSDGAVCKALALSGGASKGAF